jgi:hypothetical protein
MQKWLATVAVALMVGGATMSSGLASGSFDGLWRVEVSTQTDNAKCQERTVSLRVKDGKVRYEGLLSGIASGSVADSGEIIAQIARVRVAGRLVADYGSGAWRSKNCVGTWSARRA